MRNLPTALLLVVAFALLTAVPASAGLFDRDWKDDEINTIRSQVSTSLARITDTRTWSSQTRARVIDMLGALDDGRADLGTGTPIRNLIEAARTGVAQLAEDEAAELDAFLNSDAPAEVREQLKQLIACAGDIVVTQLDLSLSLDIPCLPQPPGITFQRLVDLIDRVPDIVLYPLYRAREFLDPLLDVVGPLLACAKEHIDEIQALLVRLQNDEVSYEDLFTDQEKMTQLRRLSKILRLAALVAKQVGPLLISASKAMDTQFEVAIWGWVGLSLDANAVEAGGRILKSSVPPPLVALAKKIDGYVEKAETASYRAAVLANQDQILRLLAPGGRSRRGG